MKKVIALALCAILLCCAVAVPAMAAGTMYVFSENGKTVNLRNEPDATVKNVLVAMPFGAAVYVDDMVGVPAGWTHVVYNNIGGFVMSRYLSAQKQAKPVITIDQNPKDSNDLNSMFRGFAQVTPYTATIVPGGANAVMRWAPTKSSGIRQKYVLGQQVTVIAESKYWVQARDEETGKVGFIWKNFTSR